MSVEGESCALTDAVGGYSFVRICLGLEVRAIEGSSSCCTNLVRRAFRRTSGRYDEITESFGYQAPL